MYQMYAYAKKYEAEKVIVIYPMNPEMERYEGSISFRSEDNVDVNVFLIDLINIEDSIKKLYDQLWKIKIALLSHLFRGALQLAGVRKKTRGCANFR